MIAARYYNNKDVRLEELPVPKIGPGEILVRTRSSGICGTDVMEWYRLKKGPRILGHEIAGDIIESLSPKYKAGQRVFVSHHVPCGQCKYCQAGDQTACATLHQGNYDPGGYSEFIRVPALNVQHGVYVLPDQVSYDEGSMIEPLACGVRGVRLINVRSGETVLILGAGVSGLLNIQLAKLKGARVVVTDINEYRLNKAREFGADVVLNAAQELDLTAEKVIVCTGAFSALEQAFRCVDKKGVILLFAIPNRDIPLPIPDFWRKELTVTSSYGAAPDDLAESLDLITRKKVNVQAAITHKFPLARIQEAFNTVVEAKGSLKVVLDC
ncbi:MAG: alcohol dehydrogenase catalytic domain-containing protein [Candidatus Omnitrophica bacterium]|nr:alcohol dehydrogenase catalytic domain-containing protein [Candidatus Omnitrophota bacterium]